MFRFHPRRYSQVRQFLSGISLRGPGAATALISFVGGAVLSLPLAILLDQTRYYPFSDDALILPVVLTLGLALILGKRGQRKIMIDMLAALAGLCVLAGVVAGLNSVFGG